MATSTPGGGQTSLGMAPNVAGLLCYLPCCPIGLVFSIVVTIAEKRNQFTRFHAFQSLLLHAAAVALLVALTVAQALLAVMGLGAVGVILWLLQMLVGVGFVALTILLMIKANGGEEFELPTIGPMAKGWA